MTVERDDEERTVEVPAELRDALDADRVAGERFGAMAFTHRKEYAEWVGSAKKDETRRRRAAKAVEMIIEGARSS